MSLSAASTERSIEPPHTSLTDLVLSFEADATGNRRLIRDILDNDPGLFYADSIEILRNSVESRGTQYLIALLVANGQFLDVLCDPGLTRDQTLALGRAAVAADPLADATLARALVERVTGQGSVVVRDANRLMEIVCEIADPARILPAMMRLVRHSNPYVRSKSVLMIGKGSRSVKWVRQKLNDVDPRVRANAVESLWSMDTDEARLLLQFAAKDGNNRVVGNAMLGLYRLGDCSVLGDLVKMMSHESSLFRASAAWIMGETGDPRFTEALRKSVSDPDPFLRKRALTALGRIKAAGAPTGDAEPWHAAARLIAGESRTGTRRVLLSIEGPDPRLQPKIPALGFILSEGGQYITSYKVSLRPSPEAMSIVFVVPRLHSAASHFYEGLKSCLKWKRNSDLWCVLPYIEAGDGDVPAPGADPDLPVFSRNPKDIEHSLSEQAKRPDCLDLWTTVWRASKQNVNAPRGKRHVLIFSTAEEARTAGDELVANVQPSRVSAQAIAGSPNQALTDFCKRTFTPFVIRPDDEIAHSVQQAYLKLLARYEVVYHPIDPEAAELNIKIQGPGGYAETSVIYPIKPKTA